MYSFSVRKYNLLFCFLAVSFSNYATTYTPWLGNLLEFEWQNTFFHQNYSKIEQNHHQINRSADCFFYQTSLQNAIPDIGVEAELIAAKTPHQRGDIDSIKLAGRYVWLDDIAGDPISLVSGLCLTKAFWPSLKDVSSFHHGLGEAELFMSVGKEQAKGDQWVNRFWFLTALGVAERGSPWLHAHLSYAFKWQEKQELELFCQALKGLGNRRLSLKHFGGYGSIDHRSFDIGVKYHYLIDYFGQINLSYAYRLYAYNFPAQTHSCTLQFIYTFGL